MKHHQKFLTAFRYFCLLIIVVFGWATIVGTGGSSNSDSKGGDSQYPNLSGDWQFTATHDGGTESFVLTLHQSGASLSTETSFGMYDGSVDGTSVILSGPGEEVETMEWEMTLDDENNPTQMTGYWYDIENGQVTGKGPISAVKLSGDAPSGGSSNSDGGNGNDATIAGMWSITRTTTYDETGDDDPGYKTTDTVTIQQTGDTIWFTVRISDPPVDWRFSGAIAGNNVTFQMDPPGTEVMTGTIDPDGNSMSGTFEGHSVNSGEKWGGTWIAARLK